MCAEKQAENDGAVESSAEKVVSFTQEKLKETHRSTAAAASLGEKLHIARVPRRCRLCQRRLLLETEGKAWGCGKDTHRLHF